MENRVCTICKESKSLKEYDSHKRGYLGKNAQCKECLKKIRKLNRKYHNEVARKWADKNREKTRLISKKYRDNNREHYRELRRAASKRERSKCEYLLSSNISRLIRHSLKGNKKGNHLNIVVEYSIYDLKKHLEKQFLTGMSWDNYSRYGWHIDHIIPIALFSFSSTDDLSFKKCWSLDNLRPLWATENQTKSDKLIKDFQTVLPLRVY